MMLKMSPRCVGSALVAVVLLALAPYRLLSQISPSTPAPEPSGLHAATFTENIGQWDSRTRLQGVVGSTTVRFASGEVGYYYNVDSIGTSAARNGSGRLHGYYLATEFLGSRPDAAIDGELPRQGVINYYLGKSERDWHFGAHTFGRVRYRNLYDGIDALYYGTPDGMKYDFVVAPGADHRAIALRYRGARSLSITPDGQLEVATPFGSVREAPPYSYQVIHGRKVTVRARYRMLGPDSYGFILGEHDPRYPVTIDPCLTIQYVTYLGGGGYDVVSNMATDSLGNGYAVGLTRAPDFPVVPANGGSDQNNYIFVSKLTPDGTRLLYSTLIAQPYMDAYSSTPEIQLYEAIGEDVEITKSGDAVVALATQIDDMPTTGGALQRQLSADNLNSACGIPISSNFDSYIVRLNAQGLLLWGTYLGGSQSDYVTDLALDPSDHLLLTGFTFAPSCGTGGDSLSYPQVGVNGRFNTGEKARGFETFVSKLTPDGKTLEFSALYGGTGNEIASKIGSDASGRIWIFGSTNSRSLVTTADALQGTQAPGLASGGYDLYLAEIDPAAGSLLYSTYYCDTARNGTRMGLGINVFTRRQGNNPLVDGFTRQDRRQGMAVTAQNGVIVFGGTTRSITLPTTPGAFQGSRHGSATVGDSAADCFVVKVDVGAARTVAATYLGGDLFDALGGLALDRQGNIVVSVATQSTNFPITTANIQSELHGREDAALVVLPPDGGWFNYGTYIGGSERPGSLVAEQTVYGVTVDRDGGVYLFGGTASPDLPVTPKAISDYNDYFGGYIVKFAPPSTPNIGTAQAINFPTQACPGPTFIDHTIFNAGGNPLTVDSIVFRQKKYFSLVNTPTFPLSLEGCSAKGLKVMFDPTNAPCDDILDTMLIYASTAQNPVTRVAIFARKACMTFFFDKNNLISNDYKLGKHDFFTFTAYATGDVTQRMTITPDPSNRGIFKLISPIVDMPLGEGPNIVTFNVNTTDTGYYCETFDVTIEPCGRKDRLKLCAYIRTGLFTTERPIDLGVISCGELDYPLVVRNTGNDSLKFNLLYVGGNTGQDIEYDPAIRDTVRLAAGDSTTIRIRYRPKGVGKRQAIMVFDTDQGFDYQRQQWVEFDAELDTVAFALTAESIQGSFGELVDFPVQYTPVRDGRAPTTEITLLTKFNPAMLDLDGADMLGTLTEGWSVVENSYVPGKGGQIRLKMGPGGKPLTGPGLLTKLRMKVLRGDSIQTPLNLELAGVSKDCFIASIDSGFAFTLSAECAAYARLLSSNGRLLKQSLPNPAGAFVTIPYTIPEPGGKATLKLYDGLGREAITLLDDRLKPGDGEVTFDSGKLPPGLYYYRLTIDGAASDTRTMMIER